MSDARLRLVLGLTLLALLWHPIGVGVLRPAFLALAGAGLLWPRALLHPALWLALPLGSVSDVSGLQIGDGTPGPHTQRLIALFRHLTRRA